MPPSRKAARPGTTSTPSDASSRNKTVRFEMPRGDADSRTLVHLISAFIQKVDILRRRAYFGDLDQAIVAGMVGVGSIDHLMYQDDFRQEFGDMRAIVGA